MEAALIYSLEREKDPSFKSETEFLLSSAEVCGVDLSFVSFAVAEEYIYSSFREAKFLYFYDEDSYLLNLAMGLGVPCFSTPRGYAFHHDLGLFYRLMQDKGIAHPRYFSFPNLKKELPKDFFTYLASKIASAGISYPFVLRKKDDDGYAPFLCANAIEFNEFLKKIKDSAWVAEEYLPGPLLMALVIGNRCFGVLEEKAGRLILASSDSVSLRAQAVRIASTAKNEAAIVMFRLAKEGPLAYGIYPARNLLHFSKLFGNCPGEALFERLIRAKRDFNPYVYVGSSDLKKNRASAKERPLANPHLNRQD